MGALIELSFLRLLALIDAVLVVDGIYSCFRDDVLFMKAPAVVGCRWCSDIFVSILPVELVMGIGLD